METTITASQTIALFRLLDDKGMTPERWTKIQASGIFADLCDGAADLGDRGAVRRALKLDVALGQFALHVDYSRPLGKMIDAGHYHSVDPRITSDLFPLKGEGVQQFEAKVFHFNCRISSEEAVMRMKSVSWNPAVTEHLLVFGEKYPEEQRKYPLVALGSVEGDIGHWSVPYLDRRNGKRTLGLNYWSVDWDRVYRFLAVRTKHPQA